MSENRLEHLCRALSNLITTDARVEGCASPNYGRQLGELVKALRQVDDVFLENLLHQPEAIRQRAMRLYQLGMKIGMDRGITPDCDKELAALGNVMMEMAMRGGLPATPELPQHDRVTPAWEDGDEEALEPLVRRLLRYMHGRESADLAGVCDAVWEKDYAQVSENAIHTAISKANTYLAKRQWPRHLHKSRGESVVQWE